MNSFVGKMLSCKYKRIRIKGKRPSSNKSKPLSRSPSILPFLASNVPSSFSPSQSITK